MHFLTVGSVESRETISSSADYEGVGGDKVRRRGSGREMGWGEGRASFFSHCSRRADTVLHLSGESYSYLGTQGVRVMNPPPSLRIPL